MTQVRWVAVLLAILGVLLITQGMTGMSSLESSRQANITTASDSTAVIGYEPTDSSDLAEGQERTMLLVENRHQTQISVDKASFEDVPTGIDLDIIKLPSAVDTGQLGAVNVTVTQCQPGTTGTAQLDITVISTDLQVELYSDTREFEIGCVE